MFLGTYNNQFSDLQIPSWSEFDCEDNHNSNNINNNNSNVLVDSNFVNSQLINEIDKNIPILNSNDGSISTSSSTASGLNSVGSSISSASSYNTNNDNNQIFDTVDLLNFTSFTKDNNNNNNNHINPINTTSNNNNNNNSNNENENENQGVLSPASSCVSPTLTSSKYFDNSNLKNNYNLESNIPPYQTFSIPDSNIISIKQEENENHDNSILNDNNNNKSNENNNKKKETKSGRVKKPMTLVQRKAHNKIERKYRININSKIANLQKLVPWMSEDGVAFEIEGKKFNIINENEDNNNNNNNNNNKTSTNNKKLNKSMILDMVTEYLLLLKDECRKKDVEIAQLKEKLSSNSS